MGVGIQSSADDESGMLATSFAEHLSEDLSAPAESSSQEGACAVAGLDGNRTKTTAATDDLSLSVGAAASTADLSTASPEDELPMEERLVGADWLDTTSIYITGGLGSGACSSGAAFDRQDDVEMMVAAQTVQLTLRDISELRTLKRPPPPLRMLMEICCILFEISPVKQADSNDSSNFSYDYWEPARRVLLSDPFFPSKLRLYDADARRISASQRATIRRYLRDPEFTEDRVRTCSKAAHELYKWM